MRDCFKFLDLPYHDFVAIVADDPARLLETLRYLGKFARELCPKAEAQEAWEGWLTLYAIATREGVEACQRQCLQEWLKTCRGQIRAAIHPEHISYYIWCDALDKQIALIWRYSCLYVPKTEWHMLNQRSARWCARFLDWLTGRRGRRRIAVVEQPAAGST